MLPLFSRLVPAQRALIVALALVPLVLATVALVPALALLPLWPGGARRATVLISHLRGWTDTVLVGSSDGQSRRTQAGRGTTVR